MGCRNLGYLFASMNGGLLDGGLDWTAWPLLIYNPSHKKAVPVPEKEERKQRVTFFPASEKSMPSHLGQCVCAGLFGVVRLPLMLYASRCAFCLMIG